MVKERLISLDVFRGLTILLMTIVNNPGDWGNVYPPLLHADWHGCTPTDLVFPFLFLSWELPYHFQCRINFMMEPPSTRF